MNHFLPKPILVIVCAGLLVSWSSCSLFSPEEDDLYFFIAEVLELEAPDDIDPGEILNIRIRGHLGPNGCYRLDRIEKVQRWNRLDLTVHGLHDRGQTFCTLALVNFDEMILVAPLNYSQDFTIVIHQPNGLTLEHTVVAQERLD